MGSARIRDFLKRWRTELRKRSLCWEGGLAFQELKPRKLKSGELRPGLLRRVRVEEREERSFIAEHAIPALWAEAIFYKRQIRTMRAEQKFKRLSDWLEQEANYFANRSRSERQTSAHFRDGFQQVADQIERLRQQLMADHKKHEERSWQYPTGVSIEHHAQKAPNIKRRPKREVELDGRFQERLASIFRGYLRKEDGVSLRTIARLVVLFLICAELVDQRGNKLWLRHDHRKVSVGSVVKRLRRGRFDKDSAIKGRFV